MAVHYLAMKGHWSAIQDIANAGGFLDHPDNSDITPLLYAVKENRVDAVRTLLLANCAPHALGNCGGDPLELALRQRQYVVAQWLLLAGACPYPHHAYLFELGRNRQSDTMLEEVWQWLVEWARQPHTLRHLCRNVIRIKLRGNQPIFQKVNELGALPQSVRDFICLRELEDHKQVVR